MRFYLPILLFSQLVFAQQSLLKSGPMVGYSEMREVQLWLQTKESARVKIAYWEKGITKTKWFTKEQASDEATFFAVKLLADQVLPGKKYNYEVYINGKVLKFDYPLEFQSQTLFQYRFSAPDFTFALGSCAYVNDSVYDRPGKPFGGGYEIYPSIYSKKPDFMLWLGDNTYLREPDWNTKTGIAYRYTHTRSLPELQPLLASSHHYATWDDHDYGPNDGDRSFWNKTITEQIFNTFWCNPNTNQTGKGGITGTFFWNDCQFFLMDDRWFRSPNARLTTDRTFLGKEQIEWLVDALKYSNATFKFICIGGQVLNPVATKENYSTYSDELQYLLTTLEKSKIPGILFFSGDRHHTELTKMPRNSSYPLYDLTVSPLLSRVNEHDEPNYFRVEGTVVREKNFGLIKVEGEKDSRKLVIQIFNAKGDSLWTKDILAKELK
jgi:alkaline phosphatase D